MRLSRRARTLAHAAVLLPVLTLSSGTAGAECAVHPELRQVLDEIEVQYGRVKVTSVCRGRHAKRSYHYRGRAVDFRVARNIGAVARYVRANVPGSHHYGGGLFHIDTGPRRPWS